MRSSAKSGRAALATPRGEERREQRLDALEEIFLAEGFRRVSVGDLARRLRCSRRTLYELAPSKERLFLRVLERLLGRIRRAGQQAAARGDLRERLVASLEPGVSELRGASGLFFADVKAFPAARRMLEAHQRARTEDLRAIIEAGIRRRVFRGIHAALVAETILATVQRVMSPEFLARADLSASESVAEVEDLILHGLLHPGRRAAPRRRAGRVAPPRRR